MSLEGPQLRYARSHDVQGEDTLAKALELARELEELLEDTRSVAVITHDPRDPHPPESHTRSTRIARAMAAGLVDELEALVRPLRKDRQLTGS